MGGTGGGVPEAGVHRVRAVECVQLGEAVGEEGKVSRMGLQYD